MNQISKIDEFFGWVNIEIEGVSYNVKYTLGSLIQLKKAGINFLNPGPELEQKLADPESIALMIHAGLPLDVRAKITSDEIAEQIPLEMLQKIGMDVGQAVDASMPEQDKTEENDSKKK